jgi:hypothetical protein
MAVLTSTKDQIRVAAAARKVGGYEELDRLARAKLAAGPSAVLTREDGRLTYVKAKPEAA